MEAAVCLRCGEMDRAKAPFHLQVGPALGTAGEAEQGEGGGNIQRHQ